MGLATVNLRRALTLGIVTVALMAVSSSLALVGLTAVLHKASRRATVALENVRLVDEMQRDLLLHERTREPIARTQLAQSLHRRLADARNEAATGEERTAIGDADRAVTSYLRAQGTAAEQSPDTVATKHAEAFEALAAVSAVQLEQVRDARATVNEYDRLADVIGATISVVVTITAGGVVWWLRSRALRPLFGLARSMRKFGGGDLEERAAVEGPAELADMARRFNEMAASIARQRKERQTFIAGVVHDLRNPLSVLRMSTDVVSRAGKEGKEIPPEKVSKVLDAVGRQVTRLERMVTDLLDSIAIETGNVRLRLEDCDARQIAIETAELYRSTSTGHVVELEVPSESVPLQCDCMRLEQVLSNLVSNAIKYSPAGGRVLVRLEPTDDEVVFLVRDEGIGMSEQDAARAFEPFRRSAKLRDEVPGTGLGLFVVRRLVEAHGGRVSVHTALAKGSTFEVRIPLRRAAQPVSRASLVKDATA